jgi:predicted ribosomally synthesized peptide with SipW-like signal peptide
MKKKVLIGLSVVALVALLAVGTWAWFTATADPVENIFTAGTVKISIENTYENVTNWNPGDEEEGTITVTNDGTKCAYVRVKLDAGWDGANLAADNVGLALNEDKWVNYEGYYYYIGTLESGDTTESLLSSVTLLGFETGNEYQGASFTVEVKADAVQCTNDAYKDVWELDALPWEEDV